MLRVLLYPQVQRAFIPISAKWRLQMVKMCIFLGEFDPLRHLSWLAEGGGGARKRLTSAVFWPSANSLAWREGGAARVCRVRVCKTRRRRAIDLSPICAFKSERVAIWQSTRRQVANDCHFTCCFHRVLC